MTEIYIPGKQQEINPAKILLLKFYALGLEISSLPDTPEKRELILSHSKTLEILELLAERK